MPNTSFGLKGFSQLTIETDLETGKSNTMHNQFDLRSGKMSFIKNHFNEVPIQSVISLGEINFPGKETKLTTQLFKLKKHLLGNHNIVSNVSSRHITNLIRTDQILHQRSNSGHKDLRDNFIYCGTQANRPKVRHMLMTINFGNEAIIVWFRLEGIEQVLKAL